MEGSTSEFYKPEWTLFPIAKATNVSDDMELEALSARMAETERMLQKILGHLERRDEVHLSGIDELAGVLFTKHMFKNSF